MTTTATPAGSTPAAHLASLPPFVAAAVDIAAAQAREAAIREALRTELLAHSDQLMQAIEALAYLTGWCHDHLAPEHGPPEELRAACEVLRSYVAFMSSRVVS